MEEKEEEAAAAAGRRPAQFPGNYTCRLNYRQPPSGRPAASPGRARRAPSFSLLGGAGAARHVPAWPPRSRVERPGRSPAGTAGAAEGRAAAALVTGWARRTGGGVPCLLCPFRSPGGRWGLPARLPSPHPPRKSGERRKLGPGGGRGGPSHVLPADTAARW